MQKNYQQSNNFSFFSFPLSYHFPLYYLWFFIRTQCSYCNKSWYIYNIVCSSVICLLYLSNNFVECIIELSMYCALMWSHIQTSHFTPHAVSTIHTCTHSFELSRHSFWSGTVRWIKPPPSVPIKRVGSYCHSDGIASGFKTCSTVETEYTLRGIDVVSCHGCSLLKALTLKIYSYTLCLVRPWPVPDLLTTHIPAVKYPISMHTPLHPLCAFCVYTEQWLT